MFHAKSLDVISYIERGVATTNPQMVANICRKPYK